MDFREWFHWYGKEALSGFISFVILARIAAKHTIQSPVEFLMFAFVSVAPLPFIIFPEAVAEMARWGFWQRYATDYDKGVPTSIIKLFGWMGLLLLLIFSFFAGA